METWKKDVLIIMLTVIGTFAVVGIITSQIIKDHIAARESLPATDVVPEITEELATPPGET